MTTIKTFHTQTFAKLMSLNIHNYRIDNVASNVSQIMSKYNIIFPHTFRLTWLFPDKTFLSAKSCELLFESVLTTMNGRSINVPNDLVERKLIVIPLKDFYITASSKQTSNLSKYVSIIMVYFKK